MDIVRWVQAGSTTTWTKWHYDSGSFADRVGRTGCGKRYPRYRAQYRQDTEGVDPKDLCRSCQLSASGPFPGRPVDA